MSARKDYEMYGEHAAQIKKWHKEMIEELRELDKEWDDFKTVRKAQEIANGYMTK